MPRIHSIMSVTTEFNNNILCYNYVFEFSSTITALSFSVHIIIT